MLLDFASTADAGEARIAVAANFAAAAREIGTLFENASGHEVLFSFGSTGQLYAQITQDAPFEAFLAADQAGAVKVIDEGFGVAGSRFTYATGRIVLYSATPGRGHFARRTLSKDRHCQSRDSSLWRRCGRGHEGAGGL